MSTNYIPEPGTGVHYNELANLPPEDGVRLIGLRDVPNAEPEPFQPPATWDEAKNHKDGESFALTEDDTNYLHVSFDGSGVVESADRYGADNVENLLHYLGDMVDEHDDRYQELLGGEDEDEDQLNQSEIGDSMAKQIVNRLLEGGKFHKGKSASAVKLLAKRYLKNYERYLKNNKIKIDHFTTPGGNSVTQFSSEE
jgi:hypothetical protein